MNLTPKPILHEWLRALNTISGFCQSESCECFIAGGSAASLLLPHTPKDVDIFVTGASAEIREHIRARCSETGTVGQTRLPDPDPDAFSTSSDGVMGASENFTWMPSDYSGLLIDVVLIERALPRDIVVEDFDLTVCMVSITGDGTLHISSKFLEDISQDILRVTDIRPTTPLRVQRYSASLPNLTVVGYRERFLNSDDMFLTYARKEQPT
jgi:hypothetical protein